MNTVNTNINIIRNREENHLNLHDSYLENLLYQIMAVMYLLMMLISD